MSKSHFTFKELVIRLFVIAVFQIVLVYGLLTHYTTSSKLWIFVWVGYKVVEYLLVEYGKFYDIDKIRNPYKYYLYLVGLIWLPTAYFLFDNVWVILEGLFILWFINTLLCYHMFVKGERKVEKKTVYSRKQFKVSLLTLMLYQLLLFILYALEATDFISLNFTFIIEILMVVFVLNIIISDMLIDSGKWYETRDIQNKFRIVIILLFLISTIGAYLIFSQNEIHLAFIFAQIFIAAFLLLLVSNYLCYKNSNTPQIDNK